MPDEYHLMLLRTALCQMVPTVLFVPPSVHLPIAEAVKRFGSALFAVVQLDISGQGGAAAFQVSLYARLRACVCACVPACLRVCVSVRLRACRPSEGPGRGSILNILALSTLTPGLHLVVPRKLHLCPSGVRV